MNMQAMLKQAQNMQKQMMNEQEKISNSTFYGENGLVKVTVKGSKQIEKGARFLPETGHILIQLISFFTALMIRLSQSTLQVMQPSALRPRHCLSGDTCMYRAR